MDRRRRPDSRSSYTDVQRIILLEDDLDELEGKVLSRLSMLLATFITVLVAVIGVAVAAALALR